MMEGVRPWLEYVEGPKSLDVRIHDPKGLAQVLGENTLARFYRCFMGADRLCALAHLWFLNVEARHLPVRVPIDSHAHERNQRLIVMLLAGTAHELGAALQAMCQTANALTDKRSWQPLDKLRGEWNTTPFGSKIRNGFSHHLGDIEKYTAGIHHDGATDPAPFYVREAETTLAGAFLEPWNALIRGEGIGDDEMGPFLKRLHEIQAALPQLLMDFFVDVLLSRGVDVRKSEPARAAENPGRVTAER